MLSSLGSVEDPTLLHFQTGERQGSMRSASHFHNSGDFVDKLSRCEKTHASFQEPRLRRSGR